MSWFDITVIRFDVDELCQALTLMNPGFFLISEHSLLLNLMNTVFLNLVNSVFF
jgi:hypothetical protein